MQIADAISDPEHSTAVARSAAPGTELSWQYMKLRPKTEKDLSELLRSIRAGRAVSALWSSESSQNAVHIACLLARDAGCRVLHVRVQQASYPNFRELEAQLDRLFDLTADQGSILVLDQVDALLCSRDNLCRKRFENYLLGRLERQQGTAIVVMPQHKRVNPRLVRRLHFALAI